jgi:hypothetical protein
MATAKSTPGDITEIQRRMAQIRRELHEDVQGALQGAQELTDWRSQVRNHPWMALGAAAVVGYMIVPRRQAPPAIVTVAPAATLPAVAAAPEKTKKRRWGLIGSAIGMLAPIAVRAVQNYAIQYQEQWIASQPPGGGAALLGAGLFPGGPGAGPGATPGAGFGFGPAPAHGPAPGARPSPPTGSPGWPRDVR